jgi:hypothetical protein
MSARRRLFVDLGAIACWLVLWFATVTVSLALGKSVVGREGVDGYLFLTGTVGVLLMSPLGLVCSIVFLLRQQRFFLFIVSAVPIGLAITLWPLLPIPSW